MNNKYEQQTFKFSTFCVRKTLNLKNYLLISIIINKFTSDVYQPLFSHMLRDFNIQLKIVCCK